MAAIEDFKKQIADLEREKAQGIQDIHQRWGDLANDVTEITVKPYKKDVLLELFGVAWMPYLVIEAGGITFELPGYGADPGQ